MARLLTLPTLAAISPARPESAKTDSSPRDAPFPKQGRSERRPETYPLGYVEDLNDARTLLADFFSILLRVVRLTSLRTVLYDADKKVVRGKGL